MAAVNENELIKAIRAKEYKRAYYFYGKDIMTIEAYTKRLSAKLVNKDDETYNLHRFEGKALDLSELSDCVDALPMFSDRVCIIINDLNAEELGADDLAFLIKIVEGIPESTTVIFYITGFDVTGGKKSPTAKNKKLIDMVSKAGCVCELSYKKPVELVKPIMEKVEKLGTTISKQNAEYLATLCLSNMVLIGNEIEKLSAYTNGNEITAEVIDLLVSRQLDSNSFALAKAVVGFEEKKAMLLLDELFQQRIEPVAILAAISMSFVDLYRAKIGINEGLQAANVTEDFGYKGNRGFAVTNAFRDVRKISVEHLRACMKILADTDIDMKSTRADGRLLIEKAITEMVVKRQGGIFLTHIEQAIIVEGKYDKIKLASIFDAVIVVTNGYGIFKDKEKLAIIRHYASTTGIIIVTDSDSAGFIIRNYLKGAIKDSKIINVYIPDVFGKEKRKEKPSKEGKLGVEGLDKDIIIEAFQKAGIIFSENYEKLGEITRMDLYEDGFIGGLNSSDRRAVLLKKLELPQLLTTNSMLEILNSMLNIEDYKRLVSDISEQRNGVD